MGYIIKDYSILSLNEVVTRRATFFKFAAALDAMASLKKKKQRKVVLNQENVFLLKKISILKNDSSGRNIDQYYRIPIWPIVIVGL